MVGLGPAEPVRDGTWALSRSGYITFARKEGWPRAEEGLYWLRLELLEPGCEETVRLCGISAGRYEAAQRETRVKSRCYRLEDRAGQQVTLTDALAQWGSLTLFLREKAGWRKFAPNGEKMTSQGRALMLDGRGSAQDGKDNLMVVCMDPACLPSLLFDWRGRPGESLNLDLQGQPLLEQELALMCGTLERDGAVRPALWRCVDDLSVCSPRDRVFTYDPRREAVTFGDGLRGAVPAAGRGAVLVANLVLSQCGGGNIPAHAQLAFVQGGVPVDNTPASGGRDKESVEQLRSRLLRELNTTKKCLSAQDFEDRARETPGLRVAAAKALPGYPGRAVVTVVVLPDGESSRPQPDERFLAADGAVPPYLHTGQCDRAPVCAPVPGGQALGGRPGGPVGRGAGPHGFFRRGQGAHRRRCPPERRGGVPSGPAGGAASAASGGTQYGGRRLPDGGWGHSASAGRRPLLGGAGIGAGPFLGGRKGAII